MELPRPHFENPPINEVAVCVVFKKIDGFQAVHFGEFWTKIRRHFPKTQDVAPLDHVSTAGGNGVEIQISAKPPLPRVWFEGISRHELIQLQDDRFIFNWRKLEDGLYPRFEEVFNNFKKYWDLFVQYISESGLGNISITQYELTYINIINLKKTPLTVIDLANVFNGNALIGHKDCFLPSPSGFNWQTFYPFPDNQGSLNINAISGLSQENKSIVARLDMVARGTPQEKENIEAGLEEWFNMAHLWIVNGFVAITTENAQRELWGRVE